MYFQSLAFWLTCIDPKVMSGFSDFWKDRSGSYFGCKKSTIPCPSDGLCSEFLVVFFQCLLWLFCPVMSSWIREKRTQVPTLLLVFATINLHIHFKIFFFQILIALQNPKKSFWS